MTSFVGNIEDHEMEAQVEIDLLIITGGNQVTMIHQNEGEDRQMRSLVVTMLNMWFALCFM